MPAKLIFASSDKSADMLYATHFIAHDPFIYFEADRKKGIIVSALEYSRAVNEVKSGVEVFEISDIIKNKKSPSPREIMVELNNLFPYNEWQIPNDFPYSIGKYLEKHDLDIKPVDSFLFPEREVHNTDANNVIKNTLHIAESGMQKAVDLLSESTINNENTLSLNGEILTSETIKIAIGIEILKGGGIAENTIVACGKDSSEPHNSGAGPIYANKPIVIDIFPRIMEPSNSTLPSGYWGDISRTFVKGKAPQIVKNAYHAVKLARDGAENYAKAGISPSDIHKFAQKVLDDCDFKTEKINNINLGFFHGLGHGVGLEIHEKPNVSLKNSTPLKENEIITIEPGLYYPQWGGIRLENMVKIEKNGRKILTKFPDNLEIP